MEILSSAAILLLSYLIGAMPFGYIFVKIKTGEDIRSIQSGRTGGTNAMRAAGFGIGLTTAIMDILKAALTVWLARGLAPEAFRTWLEVFAPVFAILGHNYSIFMTRRDENGKLKIGGGAGGACAVGGSFGLWTPSILIIFPLGALIFYFIGYASITTMSAAFLSIVLFSILAKLGITPWQYILFGVFAQVLLVWSLRGNIKRLIQGNERLHGFRARRRRKAEVTMNG